MATINPKASALIDDYIALVPAYAQPICRKLRALIHKADSAIVEDWKWGPNFNKQGMVCGFGAHKQHVTLAFFKGALLKDPKKLFGRDSDNTQTRSLRFASLADIDEKTLIAYIREAVRLNVAGVKVERKPIVVKVPAALKKALSGSRRARVTFDELAPSCRREYVEYISEARKPETRERRIKKTIELLESGHALNDKYK